MSRLSDLLTISKKLGELSFSLETLADKHKKRDAETAMLCVLLAVQINMQRVQLLNILDGALDDMEALTR